MTNSSISVREKKLVTPLGTDITKAARPAHLERTGFTLNSTQIMLLSLLLCVGVLLLMITVRVALANTLLIFVAVTGLGLWLCHRTCVDLTDPKLKILRTFWLLKLIITLFLLYVGWIPELDPSSARWGYDPQRYFQDAWTLIEDGWNPIAGSNYQGIIFFYGAIFYLFGHNPVIPSLINAFITLLGTLFLIRCVYSLVPERTAKDWTIAGLLLVPEVLWFDVITSREMLMAVMIIIATLGVGRYLARVKNVSLAKTVLLAGLALLVILVVRTSMAIPVVASIGIMVLLLRSKHKTGRPLAKVLLLGLAIAMLSAGSYVQQLTGGYDMNWAKLFSAIVSVENNVASVVDEWSDQSIGKLIAPNNAWQAVLYLPPRMLLYLVAPLPNVVVPVTELINGSWGAWQRLMTTATSAMMLLGFPFVLAGTSQTWRFRRIQPAPLVLHITFWITFMAVAGGNIIIHERYRAMFTLLLFACMWFGYTRCSRRKVRRWALAWFSLLTVGAFFYGFYKLIV